MKLVSVPGGISSLHTLTGTCISITPTSPDLCAITGAVLQCSLFYAYQGHKKSNSPGSRMMKSLANSYCIVGLHFIKRHSLDRLGANFAVLL